MKSSIKVMILFYQILSVAQLNEDNSSKVLGWIYDITTLSSFSLCLEISNIICSVKKKLLKIGFLILSKFKHVKCKNSDSLDEEEFKSLVARLIHQK